MAWYWWVAFIGGVVALLLVDLLLVHSKPHEVRTKEAALWSGVWIALGLGFAAVVWVTLGPEAGQNYLTGYLIEKSLSVDNLFVFVLIFRYFGVPNRYQHRVLFYGILGALVFRGLFIWAGVALLNNFSWVAFLFGAFLLFTAWRLATHEGVEVHPERNPVLRLLRRFVPMTEDFHGQKMIVRNGTTRVTPLLAVLLVVETTDIVFAVDSIPAIFGVTRDPFIVFSSNAFALLGLRALYFLLADLMARFRYLDVGLAVVLGVVGVKLIYEEALHMHDEGGLTWLPEALIWHIPPWAPLVAVALILTTAVVASILRPEEAIEEVDREP